jgi:uncharacterized protein (DUF4415 family)
LLFHPRQIESSLPQRHLDAPRWAASETPKRQPAIDLDKDQQARPLIVMRRATTFEITACRPPALATHRRKHLRGQPGHLRSRSALLTFDPYLDDELAKRVKRAVKSGRKLCIDVDGRSVDVKTGELIGLDTLRLDPDLLKHFRKDGPGWQTRINETLRRAVADKIRRTNPTRD